MNSLKKVFSLTTVLLLIMTVLSVSIVSASPDFDIHPGETIFVPLKQQQQQQATSPSDPVLLANPMGRIDCVATSAGGAVCDWRVAAGFKKINYSNVTVKFEKWNTATFSWLYVSTQSFNYRVNPPTPVIENQASVGMLTSGRYRATLGGTISTVEDGTFAASAEFPATFEVN